MYYIELLPKTDGAAQHHCNKLLLMTPRVKLCNSSVPLLCLSFFLSLILRSFRFFFLSLFFRAALDFLFFALAPIFVFFPFFSPSPFDSNPHSFNRERLVYSIEDIHAHARFDFDSFRETTVESLTSSVLQGTAEPVMLVQWCTG